MPSAVATARAGTCLQPEHEPPTEKMDDTSKDSGAAVASLMEQVLYEVKKVVVGQDHFLERVLVALLAKGHLLVEGVPGLAKTLTVNTLAEAIAGQFKRVQFTPHPVPSRPVRTRPSTHT